MDRAPAIRQLILADRPAWASFGFAVIAVAAPTALRWVIDKGEAGIPFVTYYPAVVLAALLLGWRWGALVALASSIVINRVFMPKPLLANGSAREAMIVGLFVLSCTALIWIAETARRLVRELEEAKERDALLSRELTHRVKNMLATVSAMAVLSASHSAPDRFADSLASRLETLKRAMELLEPGEDAQCDLHNVVETALAPFRSDMNFRVAGPACDLPGYACVPLALALHELATNAAKYGALSVPDGRVSLLWTVGEGQDDLLRLIWREEGGPPVEKPRRTGMGTQLLQRQRGLDQVSLIYNPDGVRCDFSITGTLPKSATAAAPARGTGAAALSG
ncbi:MAG TPA: HWE histidine kinase domain-containing protein [Croceibacterium sp.]|nr:HWE histidine kinase domain-containing protein [Croceibacterium sp.]